MLLQKRPHGCFYFGRMRSRCVKVQINPLVGSIAQIHCAFSPDTTGSPSARQSIGESGARWACLGLHLECGRPGRNGRSYGLILIATLMNAPEGPPVTKNNPESPTSVGSVSLDPVPLARAPGGLLLDIRLAHNGGCRFIRRESTGRATPGRRRSIAWSRTTLTNLSASGTSATNATTVSGAPSRGAWSNSFWIVATCAAALRA